MCGQPPRVAVADVAEHTLFHILVIPNRDQAR